MLVSRGIARWVRQWTGARGSIALSLCLALAACGGGGGGGGGNGGDGTSTPPPDGSSDISVAGEWNIVERMNSTCIDDDYKQYPVNVVQAGTALTVTAGGNSYSGKIDGRSVSWTGSYPEDGGTTTITKMTLTLASDANTLNGTSAWQWVSSGGGQKCEGTTQIAGQRAQPVDATAPSVPSSLAIGAVTATQLQLTWSASTDDTGVTGYKVYRNGAYLKTVTGSPGTDSGLQPATQYCYQVSALDDSNNESGKSTQQCATTTSQSDATAPSTPSDFAATSASAAINLAWTAATDNVAVTGYKLYRDGAYLTTVTAIQASDTGVTAGTQYCYQVSAVDAAGNESAKSAQQCATSGSASDAAAPSVPGNPALTATSTRIQLSWSASTDNVAVTGYRIYRGGQLLRSVTGTTVDDTGLSASTQYCYQVTATDAAGNESAKTAEQCGRTLLVGPTLAQPVATSNSVQLSWTYQWSGLVATADGYVLEESSTSATEGFAQIFSSINGTPADHASPKTQSYTRQPGTYYYRVKAFIRGTYTDWSNVVAAVVAQPTSTTVSAVPSADNSLIYSTTNPGAQTTVYGTQDLSIGCNWAAGLYASDFVCANTALMFNVQSTIAGKTIISATLRLYPYILAADYNTTYSVNAYAGAWSTSTITFANQPNYYTSNQTSVAPPTTTAVPLEFNVKAIVQAWASGTWANNGFLLRDTNAIVPGYTAYRATSFQSVDTSSTKRPVLVIEYQ
jgi:chitodextrinase